MNVDELLTHAFERFNSAVTMWNFLGTVILALIAFVASAQQAYQTIRMRLLLSVAYMFFATINLDILTQIEGQRRVFEEAAITMLPTKLSGLSTTLGAPPVWAITGIHLSADIAVIAAIWVIPIFLGPVGRNTPPRP